MKISTWFQENIKCRWYKKTLSTSAKPSFEGQLFLLDLSIFLGIVAVAFVLGIFTRGFVSSGGENPPKDGSSDSEHSMTSNGATQEGLLVLSFESNGYGVAKSSGSLIAHEGTLVRVRLQNSLETFESVPAFVQIIDHTLGSQYFGATLIGSAIGDSSVARIKMSFATLKPKSTNRSPMDFEGQALSLDGTLGIKAAKAENLLNRSLFKGGSNLLGSKLGGSAFEERGLSGILAKALIRGLQEEGSSDLGALSNNAAVLTLQAGAEFYVQLTKSIYGVSK